MIIDRLSTWLIRQQQQERPRQLRMQKKALIKYTMQLASTVYAPKMRKIPIIMVKTQKIFSKFVMIAISSLGGYTYENISTLYKFSQYKGESKEYFQKSLLQKYVIMETTVTVKKQETQPVFPTKNLQCQHQSNDEKTVSEDSWDVEIKEPSKEQKIEEPSQHQQTGTQIKRQFNHLTKISEIQSWSKKYSILAKVIESSEFKMYKNNLPYVRVKLADDSGCAEGFFKGQNCALFKVGNILQIKSGIVNIVKGRISLQINGQGRIIPNPNEHIKENIDNNISANNNQKDRYFKDRRDNDRCRFEGSRRLPPPHERSQSPRRQSNLRRGQHQTENRLSRSRINEYHFERQKRIYLHEHRRNDRNDYGYDQPPRNSQRKYDFSPNAYEFRRQPRYHQERLYNITTREIIRDKPYPERKERLQLQQSKRQDLQRYSSRGKQEIGRVDNKYKKIEEMNAPVQSISIVGIIVRVYSSQRCFLLKDETGSVEVFFPSGFNLRDVHVGNVIVIHCARVEIYKTKARLVLGQYSALCFARKHVGFYKNLFKYSEK